MKKLFLIFLIACFSYQNYAQDPNLYQTWYLHFIQGSDLGYPYEVSEIDPPIYPYITISENLDFSGEGACNTFNGAFEYFAPIDFETITFNNSTNDCGIQVHNNFEGTYFGFISGGFWYEITNDSGDLTLTFSTPIFGYALFKDYPLSTTDNSFNKLKIYPNPVSNNLYISSENTVIKKTIIYSISGKVVLKQNYHQNNSLDVSNLSKGMYFIEIYSSEGKTVKKFIKK